MEQRLETLRFKTAGHSMLEVTEPVQRQLADFGALLTIFIRHTSASLMIGENADPDVPLDMLDALDRLAPQDAGYRHSSEGPDDMPAHVKAALTATSLAVPVMDARLMLGTWQGIFLVEHRRRPHDRRIVLHFSGELRSV